MTTLVFGHKSPDTDSTGSALIWAWYLTHVRGEPAEARLLGEPNSEAAFVLRRWGAAKPPVIADVAPGDRVVIVDTNNVAELPPSINEAEVVGVIDHHLLQGGLRTRAPIEITVRPWACTATILHHLMGADAARMPDQIKGLMLSCILSDTLAFRSPTTTAVDRELAQRLAADLGIDIPAYAEELFAAKSDVSAYSDADLLRLDSKEYDVAGHRLRISVIETTAPALLLARKESLMRAMPEVARADGAEQVLLFIVDIVNGAATLLVPNDLVRRIAEASFGVRVTGDTVLLPGIMSRKKQILPALRL